MESVRRRRFVKDKICPMAIFDVLRKMNPVRQVEAAELLINANIIP